MNRGEQQDKKYKKSKPVIKLAKTFKEPRQRVPKVIKRHYRCHVCGKLVYVNKNKVLAWHRGLKIKGEGKWCMGSRAVRKVA